MRVGDSEGSRATTRRAWVITAYRSLLGFAFLVAAFQAFPDHKPVFALGLLLFNQAIASIGIAMQALFVLQNQLDDRAERKTRHTILAAREPNLDHWEFWSEVDRRVAEELGQDPEKTSMWVHAGLFFGSLIGKFVSDALTIFFAYAFAS